MKLLKIPYTYFYLGFRKAVDNAYHITNQKGIKNIIHLGFLKEDRDKSIIYSFIIGPFLLSFSWLK